MEEYSIKSIRQDFKDKGIFYTPKELAEMMRTFLPDDVQTVYDPTCGSGNLLSVFGDDVDKYGQDINESQVKEARLKLKNFTGASGDTLTNPAFLGKKFDAIVANYPFSIKWVPKMDERFEQAPTIPTQGKADYAFILHILHYLSDKGKAITLNFPGILYRGNREGQIRRWLVEQNYIEKVIHIPGNKFTDTAIATALIVFSKNKHSTDIEFVDSEKEISRTVPFKEIKQNDFNLSVSSYIISEKEKEVIDPASLQATARRDFINKLKFELQVDKVICDIEKWSQDDFMKEIIETVENWRGMQVERGNDGK